MATKPLSAADAEKLKNYLKSGSVTPYSPEFLSQLSSALKDPPKSKGLAAKPLPKAPTPQSTGLLQSPNTEFTTDNVNPFTSPFTQDAMGPTVQETISAAKPGVRALPSAVPTVEGDPNIAVSQTAPQPKITKEVTTTTKPDNTKIEKVRHTEEAPKAAKPTASNGELLLGDNLRAGAAPVDDGKPKFNHDIPSMGSINGARMGPAEAPKEGMPIPDDDPYALPKKYRFDPTQTPVPIVAQYPAQMPAIPEGRLTNTEGLANAENTATQGLTTNISALAPLPKEEEERYAALRDQRLGQIYDNEAAAKDFITSYSPRTDLSALLSFIGSQLGRDYLMGYQKPAGLGDLVGMQDKLEENIAKAKTGLSDTDMQYLKARMGLQDSQKTKEEMTSILNNSLEIAKLKAASGNGSPSQQQDRAYLAKAYDDWSNTRQENPGAGAKISAYTQLSKYGADVNKLLTRNKGIPDPLSEDGAALAQNIATQITLANRYDALLGALTGGDLSLLEQTVGMTTDQLRNWVVTNLAPEKRTGLIKAMAKFQSSLSSKVNELDSQTQAQYGPGFPITHAQNVMIDHARRLKAYKSSRGAYLESLDKALRPLGADLTEEEDEEIDSLISPERKKVLQERLRKEQEAARAKGSKK